MLTVPLSFAVHLEILVKIYKSFNLNIHLPGISSNISAKVCIKGVLGILIRKKLVCGRKLEKLVHQFPQAAFIVHYR
jgi:hypothetical protein